MEKISPNSNTSTLYSLIGRFTYVLMRRNQVSSFDTLLFFGRIISCHKTGHICYLSNKPHAAQNVVPFCPQKLRAISLFWKCVTFVTPTSNLPFWLQMEALFAFQKKIKPHKKRPPYIFQAPSTDTTVMVRVRLFYINVKAKSLFPLRRIFFHFVPTNKNSHSLLAKIDKNSTSLHHCNFVSQK